MIPFGRRVPCLGVDGERTSVAGFDVIEFDEPRITEKRYGLAESEKTLSVRQP